MSSTTSWACFTTRCRAARRASATSTTRARRATTSWRPSSGRFRPRTVTEPRGPSGSWPPAFSSRPADPFVTSALPTPQRRATQAWRPFVVDLWDELALDPDLVGGKAAALARAARAGLKILPGVVLTTAFSDAVDARTDVADHPAAREAFHRAGGAHRDLAARSSAVVEDTSESSMAGRFVSVIGIRGVDGFVRAVRAGVDSP